jgi:hypothetical protein
MQGDTSASIQSFTTILNLSDTFWVQPAHYFLAKALLQTHHLAAAENELVAAAAETGQWTEPAKNELSRLQALRGREKQ